MQDILSESESINSSELEYGSDSELPELFQQQQNMLVQAGCITIYVCDFNNNVNPGVLCSRVHAILNMQVMFATRKPYNH